MQLGVTVTDRITGFTGIVTGFVQYITGCNQALVTPRIGADGKAVDSGWFDEQRLIVDNDTPAVTLPPGTGPGFGEPAPIR